jgi:hypothetical protein
MGFPILACLPDSKDLVFDTDRFAVCFDLLTDSGLGRHTANLGIMFTLLLPVPE